MTPPRTPDEGPAGRRCFAVPAVPLDVTAMTDGELREALVALRRLSDQLDAATVAVVGAFDARTVWLGDGARSGAGWMAARTETSRPHAGALVHTARTLRSCPATDAAYAAGRIGTAKVRMLVRASAVNPELFREHEAGLVESIVSLTVAHAAVAVARWEAMADAVKREPPDGADRSEGVDDPAPDPAAKNRLHLSPSLDGRWLGDLDLDEVGGTELANAIASHVDRLFEQGTYARDDGLSAARRRAEAIVELALRGADPNRTKHGDPRPSVAITIDHRTLAGVPVDGFADAMRRRGETVDGTPISRAAAERLLCTARVAPLLTKIAADGAVETIGTTDLLRDATRRQRRALRQRDGGCVFPGCDAPVDWCDAHHLAEFSPGNTLLTNLVLICRFHHHLVHEGGWKLSRSADGHLTLNDPRGADVPCVPHGRRVDLGPPPEPPPEPSVAPPPESVPD